MGWGSGLGIRCLGFMVWGLGCGVVGVPRAVGGLGEDEGDRVQSAPPRGRDSVTGTRAFRFSRFRAMIDQL